MSLGESESLEVQLFSTSGVIKVPKLLVPCKPRGESLCFSTCLMPEAVISLLNPKEIIQKIYLALV